MRKNIKRTVLAAVALSTVMVNTLSVSAASVKDIFNAEYYENQYADLKTTFGDNKKALYQHYLQHGLSEKRNASPVLDVVAYREKYKDLDAAFGDNWDAYVNHYFTFGIKEHRFSGSGFDPIAYAEKYPDIKAAFGDDYAAIINHYLTYGIAEGRTCDTVTAYDSSDDSADSSSAGSSDSSSDSSSDNQPDSSDNNSNQASFTHYVVNDMYVYGIGDGTISTSSSVGSGLSCQQLISTALPDFVAVDSQGNSYPVSVNWSSTDFDSDTVGIYWALGTVSAADGATLPFKAPDILCSIHIKAQTDGFYGYYTYKELYGQTCAAKLNDGDLAVTVYKGSDWGMALNELVSDTQISALDKNCILTRPDISWSCDNFDGNTPGTYTATGTVTSNKFPGVELPSVTATITVSNDAIDMATLAFDKFSWNTEGTRWLPELSSGNGYYVTLNRAKGSSDIPSFYIYVQGTDATGKSVFYDVKVTWDTSNYDCNKLGVQTLPVKEMTTVSGATIPFTVPSLVCLVTVYE